MEEELLQSNYLNVKSKEELLALLDMGQITWSSLDLKAVLEMALKKLVKANDALFASIFLLDEQNILNLFKNSKLETDSPDKTENIKQLEKLFNTFNKEKPFFSSDIYTDQEMIDWRETGIKLNFTAFISLPLIPKNKSIGVVSLFFKEHCTFETEKINLLSSISHYLAIAIENARLYEESRKQAEELKALNEQLLNTNEELAKKHEEMEKLNKELKTLDQMKSNLLSNVSHELRTPLVAIKGYTDLILKEKIGTINGQQKKGLEISLKSIERLISLIDNLLNFSKIEMGIEKLKLTTFDLVELAKEEVHLIKSRADGRKIDIITTFPSHPVIMRGDRDKISQVFINLLENAVKFNAYEGQIMVDINPEKEWAIVRVSDSGIGIPQNALDKIFDRFYQVDSSHTRKYGGTGIGLSITRNIVRLHGGNISVQSNEGKGSTFTFALPLLTDEDETYQVKTCKKFSLKGIVLIYSQNELMAKEMKTFLEEKGFGTLKTSYQSEAIYIAEKYKPELIIWSLETVDNETLEKLSFLKKNIVTSPIPLIIISKFEGLEKKYQINADFFMSEPIDRESFIFIIEKYLSMPVYVTGKRPSILILSDNPQLDNYLTCAIANLGLITLSTSVMENSIEDGLTYNPSVIILDSEDPKKHIPKIMKLTDNNTPVLVITNAIVNEIVNTQKNLHFLTHPITFSELQEKIKLLLNRETICFVPISSSYSENLMEQKTVLVVDDETEIVNFIDMALSSEGYKIISAYSGPSALEIIEKETPGMILLDIAMAEMDGIEVCRKVKTSQETRMIPVYMITALLTEEIKERSIEAGADGFLAKPFKINTLINTVKKVIGQP